MSQQPDSSPRITRRLETQPAEPATTPGDGKPGPRDAYPEPQNLHQAITQGLESALRDFGLDLGGCPPAILSGHVMRELKRIPGWRPPAQVIESADHLDTLPIRTVIVDQWDTVWRHGAVSWFAVDKRPDAPARIVLPATVVHIPAEIGDTE